MRQNIYSATELSFIAALSVVGFQFSDFIAIEKEILSKLLKKNCLQRNSSPLSHAISLLAKIIKNNRFLLLGPHKRRGSL